MRLCWIGIMLVALALGLKAVWPAEKVALERDFEQLEGRYVLIPERGDLRILDAEAPVRAEVRVNHPLRWHGWWIYAAGEGFVAIRDRFWPIAALGGLLMLLGAAWRCVCPKR